MKSKSETKEAVRRIAKRVASVEIPIKQLRSHLRTTGDRRSIHRGEGDDFDGHDIYAYGDDPRSIDWNATALTAGQQIFVGLYKEEMQIRGTVLCDVSPTMDFGSRRVNKRTLAAELSAVAVKSLGVTHDPVSLITFSDTGVERRVPSRAAASMVIPTIKHILESKYTPKENAKNGLAKALNNVPRSPSVVFVVSDFLNTTEADWEALKRAGRRHQVYVFYVQDIRERELPALGWVPYLYTVQDHSGERRDVWVTRGTRRKHQERFLAHEAKILERLKASYVRPIVINTAQGDTAVKDVLKFLAAPYK